MYLKPKISIVRVSRSLTHDSGSESYYDVEFEMLICERTSQCSAHFSFIL